MPYPLQNYQNPGGAGGTGLRMNPPRQTSINQHTSLATPFRGLGPSVSSLGSNWWGAQPQQQQQQPAQAPQGSPGAFQAQTSIQPQGVFPSQYTQQAGNLAAALAIPAHNDLYAARAMPGVSGASPNVQWGIGADVAGGLANALMAPQAIGLAHYLQNAQQMLAGQQGRDQEALGWGRLGLQNLATQYQGQVQGQGDLLSALAGLYQRWG